jgi:hypothetical protein
VNSYKKLRKNNSIFKETKFSQWMKEKDTYFLLITQHNLDAKPHKMWLQQGTFTFHAHNSFTILPFLDLQNYLLQSCYSKHYFWSGAHYKAYNFVIDTCSKQP